MKRRRTKVRKGSRWWNLLSLPLVGVFLLVGPTQPGTRAPLRTVGAQRPLSSAAVPPFHKSAETARPLPPTLSPVLFKEEAAAKAYQVAQKIPEVLAQQPCYCHCARLGHGSLLDCYMTNHAAT